MNDNDKPKGLMIGVVGTGSANMRMLEELAGKQPSIAEVKDPILMPPDLSGPHGKAWKCNLVEGYRVLKFNPENDACLVHWVVEAPWAHPIWHSYSIVCVHLRPMADNRPTLFYMDGATHELWVWALDPGVDRAYLIGTGIPKGMWMTPKNFGAQFIEISDDLARERVQKTVQEICDGKLSPDTDFLSEWVRRYGDNMIKDEWR